MEDRAGKNRRSFNSTASTVNTVILKGALVMSEEVIRKSEQVRGKDVMFCRLRRITGYLTDDTSRWGEAKQAEEHDRVKHTV